MILVHILLRKGTVSEPRCDTLMNYSNSSLLNKFKTTADLCTRVLLFLWNNNNKENNKMRMHVYWNTDCYREVLVLDIVFKTSNRGLEAWAIIWGAKEEKSVLAIIFSDVLCHFYSILDKKYHCLNNKIQNRTGGDALTTKLWLSSGH